MKFKLTLALAMFLATSTFAQIEWLGSIEFSDWTKDILLTPGGNILVHQGSNLQDDGMTLLNSEGVPLHSVDFNDYWFHHGADASEMVMTPDSGFVYFATRGECDIIVSSYLKFDKDFNYLWQQYEGIGYVKFGVALSNGEIVWINYVAIEKLTAEGEPLWEKNLPLNAVDFGRSPGDSLLLLTESGLYVLDHNTGDSLAHFPQILGDRLETLPDGQYLLLRGDTLQLFSTTFGWLKEVVLANDGIVDVAFNDDQIVALAQPPHVFRFDPDLEPLGDFSLAGADHSYYALALRGDDLLLGGREGHGPNHYPSSAFVKSFGFDGTTTGHGKDVGVVQVEPVYGHVFQNNQNQYVLLFDKIKVQVTNYGTSPVNELRLNTRFKTLAIPWWCELPQLFSRKFTNLNLQPGQTKEVSWNSLEVLFNSYPSDTVSFCMTASRPDGRLDDDHSNDRTCSDFLVSTQRVLGDFNFQISPNPAPGTTILYYALPPGTRSAEARLSDYLGRRLAVFSLENEQGEIPLENLPAGLHFVTLVVEGRVVETEKLMVF